MLHTIQAFIITLTFTAFTFASGAFISEYAEGSSYNKYIEIYNGTGSDVDLSTYELWKISNGGDWAEGEYALSGTLADGDVYVVCHSSSDEAIKAECDMEMGLWWNGDDAVGLAENDVLLDAVGSDGADPGSSFDVCGNGDTKDNTIVRNSDVTEGNTDWATASCEYTVYSNNTWDYLGSHTCDACGGGGGDTCEDESACNTGAEGDCEYPDTGYDCDGNCVGDVDCAGVCGGDAVEDCSGACGGSAENDACGVCGGDDSSCSVNVTFSVDMSIEGVAGDIKLRTSTVNGEYNPSDWHVMTDGGDGTYSHTLSLLTGAEYGYNFNNSDGSGYESGDGLGDCAGGNYGNDRYVTPGDSDITLDTVCWESCEGCPAVVEGCTDETATNYDPDATVDDGTCEYPELESANLFISEAAEGSSNHKYIEIYNASNETVDLASYAFANTANAPNTPGEYEYWTPFDGLDQNDANPVSGSTSLSPGDVYVVCDNDLDATVIGECDQYHAYLSNGDDGFCLVFGSEANFEVLDCVGDWNGDGAGGYDPWDVAGVSNATKDHTLVRKASVDSGNGGDWASSAGTDVDDSEWEVYDQNTWDYLGSHTMGGDECTMGDVNGDGLVNVLDIVQIVAYIVDGDANFDTACADNNGDGVVNVLDVVALVSDIVNGGGRFDDAASAQLIKSANGLTLKADGYIGGVQMTLSHGADFTINLSDNAWISDYSTSGSQTILVIVEPAEGNLFTTSGDFEIVDMIIANSHDAVSTMVVREFALSDAYPNPFNPSTTVELTVPEAGHVSVMVYNITGQLIAELADSYMGANQYQFTWQGENVPSGMYLLRAEYAGQVSTQKLMLLK